MVNVLMKSTKTTVIEVVLIGFFVVNFELICNNNPEAYLGYCETPTGICLFKVNNENTRAKCEICSKLTKKTPDLRPLPRSGVFIVNVEQISHIVLVCSLLTLCR